MSIWQKLKNLAKVRLVTFEYFEEGEKIARTCRALITENKRLTERNNELTQQLAVKMHREVNAVLPAAACDYIRLLKKRLEYWENYGIGSSSEEGRAIFNEAYKTDERFDSVTNTFGKIDV